MQTGDVSVDFEWLQVPHISRTLLSILADFYNAVD